MEGEQKGERVSRGELEVLEAPFSSIRCPQEIPCHYATLGRLDLFMPTPSHPKLGDAFSPREGTKRTQTPIAMLRTRLLPPKPRMPAMSSPYKPWEDPIGGSRRDLKLRTGACVGHTRQFVIRSVNGVKTF